MAEKKKAARKKGKKNRKFGRNKIWCQAYKGRCQREKNKLRRITKHLGKHPNDKCAVAVEGRLRAAL